MILERSERFKKQCKKLPLEIRKRVNKALLLLSEDPHHPSLGNKKMEGADRIWELRVIQNYRITYEKIPGGVFLRRVGTHDVLRNP